MKLFGKRESNGKKEDQRGSAFKFGWWGQQKKARLKNKKDTEKQAVPQSGEKVKKQEDKIVSKEKAAARDTKDAYKILTRPHVTEKTTIAASDGTYVFVVASCANKIEVKKAVYNAYGVMPQKVAIINQAGKQVGRGKNQGWTKKRKKVMVVLPKGERIDVYSGV